MEHHLQGVSTVSDSRGAATRIAEESELDTRHEPTRPVPVSSQGSQHAGPRIALLTPYTGSNFGDGAIQDATIANLRSRFPAAQFSGISLNCASFSERHGAGAYPLCTVKGPFYNMSGGSPSHKSSPIEHENPPKIPNRISRLIWRVRNALGKTPVVGSCLRNARRWALPIREEISHCLGGYRFLRAQDLMIVSGGGQLDEEWGGPWGHPYSLFKWAILARLARIPFVFASVGACKVNSSASRFFVSVALRLAAYRSYRDKNSRKIAASLFNGAALDSVVPDLAFSLQLPEGKPSNCVRMLARGRTIFAVSPMAYAKPGCWPVEDSSVYDRYLRQMARLISQLLERDGFLVMVSSTAGDRRVFSEILEYLDDHSRALLDHQLHIPEIASWRDLIAVLRDVDFLVASRLHSVILGFVVDRPTVAISFDAKVDWIMEDLGQTQSLLQIRDFVAEDVVRALGQLDLYKQSTTDQICSYRQQAASQFTTQYDVIAGLTPSLHSL
jgi:polysaccharide pyruvyl transferase WcaK-like protein